MSCLYTGHHSTAFLLEFCIRTSILVGFSKVSKSLAARKMQFIFSLGSKLLGMFSAGGGNDRTVS